MSGRNVELKASLDEADEVARRILALGCGGPTVLQQTDTFFLTSRGRLKLRRLGADGEKRGELIFYERPDEKGPKTSHYVVTPTEDCDGLEAALAGALGVRAVVRKERRLFTIGRTRVHLDRVEGLGEFLEFEVVLAEDEEPEAGRREAFSLLERLGVSEAALLEGAYVDLLEKRESISTDTSTNSEETLR